MNITLPATSFLKKLKWRNVSFLFTFFIFCTTIAFSQASIDITTIGTGLASSPLQGGSTNRLIFKIVLDKSSGAEADITQIVIQFSQDPSVRFTSATLYKTSDGSTYPGSIGSSSITFTENSDPYLTNFNNSTGNSTREFHLFVDVDPTVTGSTLATTPSITEVDVISQDFTGGEAITVNAVSLSGTSYSFSPLSTTISSLNAGANNVATSPLTPGATGRAVLGFSLLSNGSQTVSQLNIQLSSDPSGKLGTWSLVRSGDADFATGGDNTTIGSLSFAPSSTELVITGLSEDVSSTKRYFLVATVGANPGGTIQASLGTGNITFVSNRGYSSGTSTGTNYSFLTTAIGSLNAGANNVAGSPLVAGATGKAVFGFSLLSGGTQNVSAIRVQLSNDPTSVLSGWSLVRSGDTDFASTGDNVTIPSLTFNPSTSQVEITGLTENVSTAKNYFLVANVDAGVDGLTLPIQASLGIADVSVDVGAVTGSVAGTNYNFAEITTTVAPLTTGVAPSPLLGVSSNQAILGFSLTSNATQDIDLIDISFDTDPSVVFNSYSLVQSVDNSFATAGDNTVVPLSAVTPSGSGPFILGFDPTADINVTTSAKNFFIVANVNDVSTASSVIQPSLPAANVSTTPGIASGSVTGIDYATQQLTTTVAQLTTGIAPSPLVANNTSQAVLGFSLTSNGTQVVDLIEVSFDTDPDLTLNTYSLVQSVDNSFATTGDNTVITLDAPPTPSGSGPFLLDFDPTVDITVTTSAKNFFIVANINGSVTNTASVIQPSLNPANVSVDFGIASGTVTGTDYATQILTTTIASITTGVAPSPLIGGNVNQAILGFSLTSNASQTASLIKARFDTDPTLTFNTFSLVLSTDNSFATTGDNSVIPLDAIPALSGTGPFFLDFDPVTNITLNTTAKNFFIVANVNNTVGTTSSVILPSITDPDVSLTPGVVSGSSVGIDYATQQLTTTIALATTGVAPSPLVEGNTNQAILGFSLTSNGSQSASLITARFDTNPDATFNTYSLVQSVDNSFATTGDNTVVPLDAVPVPSGGGPYLLDFDPTTNISLSTSAKYFFIVANVDLLIGNASSVIQPSLTSADVTLVTPTPGGVVSGSAVGTDYSTAALIANLAAINGGTAPVQSSTILEAGQTLRVLSGFSAISNGSQELSSINFNTAGLLGGASNQFTNVYLYRSTTVGSVGTSLLTVVNGNGNFNDLSTVSLANKTVSTSTVYYYLVVDVKNDLTTATAGVTVTPNDTHVVFTTGNKNLMSINRSFTFTQSLLSDIALVGGNSADIIMADANTADETPGGAVTTANSSILATFALRDGGLSGDLDNLPTIMDGLTISVENPGNLDQIALFDETGTKIPGTDKTPAASLNWTSLNYSTVTDNTSRNFTIRASFKVIVTDKQQTDIAITSTTFATSAGSLFAATNAGGADTDPSGNHNRIQVNSTKLLFVDAADLPIVTAVTAHVGPDFAVMEGQPGGDQFDVIVVAVDDNNNLDIDRTTSITLSINPGSTFKDDGAAVTSQPMVGGIVTFTNLTIADAGTYDISAAGASHTSATGATALEMVIQSPGVGITPALLSMCKSNSSGVYQVLPNIVLDEANNADFGVGSNTSFLLILPSGWEFNTSVTGAISYTGGQNISSADATFTFLGNTIAKFIYSVSNTNKHDALTLSGLQVRNTGGFNGVITKGGTGVIKGCCDDSKYLGLLTTTSATAVDFSVKEYPGKATLTTNTTKFAKSSPSQPIILIGEVPPGDPGSTPGTIGSFSGAGVSSINIPELGGTRYTFNPNILAVSTFPHYPITFSYADGSGCLSEVTKNFEVYDGAINGLNDFYCADNTTSQNIKVNDTFRPADAAVVIDGDTAFSLQIPSYKYMSEVVNNGGTMTVTIRNHGFSNGQTYQVYIANGSTTFSGPDAPYGYIYKQVTVSNATTNTFDINVNVVGTWDRYTGIVYLPANYYLPFTSVVNNGGTSLTITIPDHGYLNGAKPYLYVELYNPLTFSYSYLEGFFPIQNATTNTFQIPVSVSVANTWSGYGYTQSNWYRITSFVPDIKLLNRKLINVNSYEVGYFVKYNWCTGAGCDIYYMVNQTPVQLNPIPIVTITSPAPMPASFCDGDAAITIIGSESTTGGGTFGMTTVGTITNVVGTGTATFDPDLQPLDTNLGIQYSYTDGNGCTGTITTPIIVKSKLAAPTANPVTVCQYVQASSKVFATVSSSIPGAQFNWYGNAILTDLRGTGNNFDTGLTTSTTTTANFYVTQVTANACESPATQVTVNLLPQPSANFSPPTICEGRLFTVVGPQAAGPTPHPEYIWDFGEGTTFTVSGNNTQDYTYATAGTKTIRLDVKDANDCINFSTSSPTVNPNPIPTFSYNQVCENDNTQFTGQLTTSETATQFSWDFYRLPPAAPKVFLATIPATASGAALSSPFGGTAQNPTYEFTDDAGEYEVTVRAYNALGCFSNATKQVTILEYLPHTTNLPYDMDDVDGGRGHWKVQDISVNSSWRFADPTTPILGPLTNSWITQNVSGVYNADEYSFLNSPCFDISGVLRPTLSLNFGLDTGPNDDGVVLEYSIDGGVTWASVGGPNSGLNWFNTAAFSTAPIGSSSVGWSGSSLSDLDDNPTHDAIVLGRRALETLLTPAQRTKVRFRIAFKTNNSTQKEGFGFNNFRIETRDRLLLVEHFTNQNDAAYGINKAIYDGIDPIETIKLQYHLGYPASDPNSEINSPDQTARAGFYGVALTDPTVPRAYIDGYSNGPLAIEGGPNNGNIMPWSQNRFDKRSLVPAKVDITIQSPAPSPTAPEYLKAEVTIVANENIASVPGVKPMLHIAAVEKLDADGNEYVLRKFFTSPTGVQLNLPMSLNQVIVIKDSITVDWIGDDISLIAWVQDENNIKEVYQASVNIAPVVPAPITGVEAQYAEKIEFYPNPSNQHVSIQLPAAVTRNTPVKLIDSFGRAVYESTFVAGEKSKAVNTSDFASGVYIMQVNTPDGRMARKRLMVIHK